MTGEEYARRLTVAALDACTRLDVAGIAEKTGLPAKQVAELVGKVTAERARRAQPAPVEEGWRAGIEHPNPGLRKQAAHILLLIDQLQSALKLWDTQAAARARRDALLAELAELNEALGVVEGKRECPQCGKQLTGPQGLATHVRRAHRPKVVAA